MSAAVIAGLLFAFSKDFRKNLGMIPCFLKTDCYNMISESKAIKCRSHKKCRKKRRKHGDGIKYSGSDPEAAHAGWRPGDVRDHEAGKRGSHLDRADAWIAAGSENKTVRNCTCGCADRKYHLVQRNDKTVCGKAAPL